MPTLSLPLQGNLHPARYLPALHLPAAQVISLQQAAGWQIACLHGQLWLTETGVAGDTLLEAGMVYTIAGNGRVVTEALHCADQGSAASINAASAAAANINATMLALRAPAGRADAAHHKARCAGKMQGILNWIAARLAPLRRITHADACFARQNAGLHLTTRHAGL